MVRDGDRTVITMVNDFQGDVTDFAMVIPAPTVLEREQIHVTEGAIVDHLDAFTAPRLVEYHDPDPCAPPVLLRSGCITCAMTAGDTVPAAAVEEARAHGVTIEAEYQVGEYDIVILSATQSDGLATWLTENGYRIPEGAAPVLGSYIAQDMKFFVAKVNLAEHARQGGQFLRPIQIAFESPKFMLPIRLGTVNAQGSQDLLLWTLTRKGRVETVNYRTVRMPTDANIPTFVEPRFGEVYKAMYSRAVEQEGGAAVMLEYAWDMSWCDPCAADPLSARELRELGVFWIDASSGGSDIASQGQDVFVTRLHARYDAESFPEDLRFTETGDRTNFQGRYIMTHPFTGEARCAAGDTYRAGLPARFAREAETLAHLTGWDLNDIRTDMADHGAGPAAPDDTPWWKKIWQD